MEYGLIMMEGAMLVNLGEVSLTGKEHINGPMVTNLLEDSKMIKELTEQLMINMGI